jgi:hypothetical protein
LPTARPGPARPSLWLVLATNPYKFFLPTMRYDEITIHLCIHELSIEFDDGMIWWHCMQVIPRLRKAASLPRWVAPHKHPLLMVYIMICTMICGFIDIYLHNVFCWHDRTVFMFVEVCWSEFLYCTK